ncbi:putative Melibiase subfamily [Thozetella sp. PMI_491]|nr:putative Melibiase subfamily [Thozetella sp. PMI_491]
MGSAQESDNIVFGNGDVTVVIGRGPNGNVFLQDIVPGAVKPEPTAPGVSLLPLCEIRLSGEGNISFKSSKSLIGTYVGSRLRYVRHSENYDANSKTKTLDVELHDEKTKITTISHLKIFDGLPFVQSSATVRNDGSTRVVVTQVSSLVVANMTKAKQWWSDYLISFAKNTWCREAQWQDHTPSELGVDDLGIHRLPDDHAASMSEFILSNRGTFSTQGHLPMGLLRRKGGGDTWIWQIENNGSWKWEIGDFRNDLSLSLSGPSANEHEWRLQLAPGASFTSVTASICHLFDDAEAAFAKLTEYRRRIIRPHADNANLPIIFNDYMNCLMGDPTEEKILALIGPVAKSGAEYFVIDCGWYADDGNWWDDVGTWEPSKKRFPSGFQHLLGEIRKAGLKPGLWLEPEVIGVRSVMAKILPDDAFFQRDGERVVEKNRYHLDFRHSAVRKRMDEVVDKLVTHYGAAYFKFDYNVEISQGTDVHCFSGGVGQLEHNRAYLDWVRALLDRYPELVIENCSSGAQRMDYAMLAVHPLQSTSDQQHPELYAAISAAIPTAVLPEQGATWAYPQGNWDDEKNALTVVNSLLGRIHLSGRLDTMSAKQLEIIYEGMSVYKVIRADIPVSVPFWPLGLPKWHDNWLALGLAVENAQRSAVSRCYVAIWRRGGSETCALPFPFFHGRDNIKAELIYPAKFVAEVAWSATDSTLNVRLPAATCARLYRLTAE